MGSELNHVCLLVDDFITYKRTLGYKYGSESRILNTFKRFLSDSGAESPADLNKELIENWCSLRINESRKSQSNRICTLRQFAIYLNNKGYCVHLPEPIYNSANKTFVPYIFTAEEMGRIFKTLDGRPTYTWTNAKTLYPVLYRMLYGCGLRINEALSLKVRDVDVENGTITVLHAKNDTSRLVVMSASLREICADYKKQDLATCGSEDFFFPSKTGGKRSRTQVSSYFKEILWEAGITYCEDGRTPRLHDVRHTFCCHTFKQMADSGIDLYCALPILSAYLGHEGIRSTEKYLWLTKSIFPEIITKSGRYMPEAYPEVYHE